MNTQPTTAYEVRVEGHLDRHWSDVLAGLAVRHHADGTSTLAGPIADQAQLHGVLKGLQNIGATLLAVQVCEAPTEPEPDPSYRTTRRAVDEVRWPLRTARLVLRPARVADAEATWAFRRLEEVGCWLTGIPTDLDAYRAVFSEPARLATTLIVEHDGAVVGDLMLRVEDAWGQAEVADQAASTQAELGWVLDPGWTGTGFATEAVRELVRACFEDLGLRRVVATCFAENTGSWKLMERVGMRRELHAERDALHRSGVWSDTYGYALLAEDWSRDAHARDNSMP